MAVVESYQPSGKVAWGKLPAGLLVGGGVGTLAVVVYAILSRWNPLRYIPLSIAGVHFADVGMILYWVGTLVGIWVGVNVVVKRAKCRHPFLGLGIGIGLGLFFFYVHWMTFGVLLTSVFILPHETIEMLQRLVDSGWFNVTLKEDPSLNWIFWGIEATGIVGTSVFSGILSARVPFCEACEKWADNEFTFDAHLSLESQSLKDLLEAAEFEQLQASGPAANPNAAFLRYRFTVNKCPDCDHHNVVRIESVSFTHDKDGNVEEKTTTVVSGLLLQGDALTQLRRALTAVSPMDVGLPPRASL